MKDKEINTRVGSFAESPTEVKSKEVSYFLVNSGVFCLF